MVMTNEIKAQLLQFISEAKTLEGLSLIEARVMRISEGEVPADLMLEATKRRVVLQNEMIANGDKIGK